MHETKHPALQCLPCGILQPPGSSTNPPQSESGGQQFGTIVAHDAPGRPLTDFLRHDQIATELY